MSEMYTYGSNTDVEAEDAPTVEWVDQTIQQAEAEGRLGELGAQVDNTYFTDLASFGGVVEQAQSGQGAEIEPSVPLTREEIREKIFAKLRRPDGTPYAAGYVEGPAARKADYEGEDERAGSWRMPRTPGSDDWVTDYDDRTTLDDRASRPDDQGRVVDSSGTPVDGSWGWVIDDETGAVLLFDPANATFTKEGQTIQGSPGTLIQYLRAGWKIVATHHTSPVAGMPVTGAGMMTLREGFLQSITDESGHYRPDGPQQHAALQELMDQGYSLEEAQVQLTGRSGGGRPTDKAAWLDEAARDNPDFPTGNVTLRPDQFMQTGGDEYQIRNKMALNAEINRRGERDGTVVLESEGTGDAGEVGNYAVYDPDAQPGDYGNYGDNDQNADAQPGNYGNYGDNYQNDNDQNIDGETPEQVQTRFVDEAHTYLTTAGRSAFAEFFAALPVAQQDLLVADPRIGTSWRAAPAATPQGWQPAEEHHAAAAQVNASSVDALDDRASAPFTVAGFSVLIGDGHDDQHRAYADAASDAVTGTVTVRKAGLGRGAGSLTFTGVPPAKQEIVRSSVARFSRKDVRFE